MSWKNFFNNYKYRLKNFFLNKDPENITKILISANIGAYFSWKVVPGFMRDHFVMSEQNTIRKSRYYTILTSSISHPDFIPMFFNSITLWFFASPVIYSIGPMGILSLYFSGTIFNFLGLYSRYKYNNPYGSIPITVGANASVSAIMSYFIIQNPWQPIFLMFIPMPAVILGLVMLYLGDNGRENTYFYGGLGGAFVYLIKAIAK
ncbi:hypothetical protein SteCoe_12460 [Stentor coeruleus]|uniref:Peptidase S54 rhomboid domain-containing protein n=1 Tax=Stentor coeruleus TaxID=5963 RepID=A0A1R2CAT2_9CILI|nr:hypothetical protein SteCoe_12460 [Stentor coeruleus]